MSRLAALVLLALLTVDAAAQAGPRTPLTFDKETVGGLLSDKTGRLKLPEGKAPFPAVVILSGCNGVKRATRVWAHRLTSWGYAALIVDSFTPRGLENVCHRGRELPGPERAKDALAAAAYLRTRPDIDPTRIGLLGYSHGGWSAITAARQSIVEASRTPPFAAIVAYYPNCPPGAPPLVSDLLILAGSADDWAPATRCTALVERYAGAQAHMPVLKIYPGAPHSFDVNRPERVYLGHRLAYDAAAATDSFAMARQFLDTRLQR